MMQRILRCVQLVEEVRHGVDVVLLMCEVLVLYCEISF